MYNRRHRSLGLVSQNLPIKCEFLACFKSLTLCSPKITGKAHANSLGRIAAAFWAGVDINEFPALKAWDDRMLARPAVEKGRHVPDPHKMKVRQSRGPKAYF
jgi:hypothetical protein